MVKADVKHNYYADLDLPTTASIDDIKRQYRKLALQYHPDRNAGREDEFVPKFQAIQTAHEILGDATTKSKYDVDRRKAGLYPTYKPSQPTPGNPYAATSAYPPPPRRTQPGTYQRPQPQQQQSQQQSQPQQPSPGATPTGADRYANFPRGAAPTARKDPAQDRTNMFRAWQNMNNAQERQQSFRSQNGPSPQPSPQPPPRPRPPPRQDTKLPSEDEIRAGMNYRKAPPPPDTDRADRGPSAWSNFQQANAGKPGVSRSNTSRTPKKQGFDPNAPGSDERPAGGSGYAHRHRSEDFGQAQPGKQFPPPPPGPPPLSPLSSGNHRPFADPLRPFRSREADDQTPHVPYSEGNRTRTPYSSFIGEKTQFTRDSSDGLRRSASTRDTTKLGTEGAGNERARSTSPLGRQSSTKGRSQKGAQQPFVDYSSSDASGSNSPLSSSPLENPATEAGRQPAMAPHSTAPSERPKKAPAPPSRKFNGSANPRSPPPTVDDAQSDTEQRPGMQQKASSNMYVNFALLTHDVLNYSPYSPEQEAAWMFGTSHSKLRTGRLQTKFDFLKWAVPSSVVPGSRMNAQLKPRRAVSEKTKETMEPAVMVDMNVANATPDQQAAYDYLRFELHKALDTVPEALDMDVFLKLASTAASGQGSGNDFLDSVLGRALSLYPSVGVGNHTSTNTDNTRSRNDSFTFPAYQHVHQQQQQQHQNPQQRNAAFTPTSKSRSEENINTSFSPEGWSGTFQGSPDYFTSSTQSPQAGKKPGTPRQRSSLRSATMQSVSSGTANGGAGLAGEMRPPPRPTEPGSAQPGDSAGVPEGVKFSKEEWEKTFQDASWTWPPPPPPPKPPSPAKVVKARTPGRKASKSNARRAASGTREQPYVIGDEEGGGVGAGDGNPTVGLDDGDAMDIDPAPPAGSAQQTEPTSAAGQTTTISPTKEPRLYSVPPSPWRQSQTPPNGHARHPSARVASEHKLHANLDDLASVAPLAQQTDGGVGLKNLADLNATLPFQSQASAAVPTHPLEPKTLQIPALPKPPEPPTQLTKSSWAAYVQGFGAYLKAYHVFNSNLLQHFATREQGAQARLASGLGWLEASGETTGGGGAGFGSYLQGVKEDERVREAWSLGAERHGEACRGFEKVRGRVREKMAGAGLTG